MMPNSVAQHTILIYTGAALITNKVKAGVGIVAKDWWGNVITKWAIAVKYGCDEPALEAFAIRVALTRAVEGNWASVLICLILKQ